MMMMMMMIIIIIIIMLDNMTARFCVPLVVQYTQKISKFKGT